MKTFAEGPWLIGFSERSDGDLAFINQTPDVFRAGWQQAVAKVFPEGTLPCFAHQIHETGLIEVTDPEAFGLQGKADALMSALPGLPLGVFTADCLPVIIATPTAIAAVHAGWRSARGNITGKTLSRLISQYGCPPGQIRVFMGPCIGPCCLEMGDEVRPGFIAENPASSGAFTRSKKWHLDLRALNICQCLEAGVPWRNLTHVTDCTKCLPEGYFSYRGDRGREGSLFSFIVRRPG